ncbi:hypothetical protein D3C81_2173560 [compost metagenome]
MQVSHAQVLLQATAKAFAAGALAGQACQWAIAEFLTHHFGEQIILGREVVVKGTAGQPDGLHQPGHAGAGKATAFG